MTKEQFLDVFTRHLNIGGTKRKEIVLEVTSHLQEQPPEQLGDPTLLARKINRVHLGIFSSFLSLAVTAVVVVLLFDIIIPYVGLIYHGSPVWKDVSLLSSVLWQCVPFISPLLFIYGSHTISRMRNRWANVAIFAVIFTAGFAISQELMQALGYLFIASADGSQSLWTIHIEPVIRFLFTYVIIGYGMLAMSAGRQRIVAGHHIIDVLLAFVLEGAAAYVILPIIWNAITSFYYTEKMYEWSVPVFENLILVSVCIGLLGAGFEWYRVRRSNQLNLKG